MPALQNIHEFDFVGIGVCTPEERFGNTLPEQSIVDSIMEAEHEKAKAFINQYGGKLFEGYKNIVASDEIDAIYIPLPPALHYRWAKIALESGKHVLVEKPSTISGSQTLELAELALKKGLGFHENYMFAFHQQIADINQLISDGEIGDVRLYRIAFGFPRRAANDFRYNKALGGGALIDAGGYTIKYATMLLGESARLRYAQMNYLEEFEVDIFGSAALVNDSGMTAQIAFGMDNNYKCELEAWGSKGFLTTGRVLTAPDGFTPTVTIRKGNNEEVRNLSADDAFGKSIHKFIDCIKEPSIREQNCRQIVRQAQLIDDFYRLALQGNSGSSQK